MMRWGLIALTALLTAGPVVAQTPARAPAADTPATAPWDGRSEYGELAGATIRIDVPTKWNGGLVVMNHGYDPVPRKPPRGAPNARAHVFTDRGYAVAQSSYSKGGWALEQAMGDNQTLIAYFKKKYGKTNAIFATGGAMGAATTMTSVELYPNLYTGGLVTCCGTMAPSSWEAMTGSFRMMALFDYYFPGVLPPPVGPLIGFTYGGATDAKIEAAFKANPQKAEIFRRTTGRRLEHLANHVSFQSYISHEMQQRSGGNPFDNSTYIYTLDDDPATVNAGVKRYVADQKAMDYAKRWYTPTGRPKKPIFIMSPVYDPVVTINNSAGYMDVVRKNGGGDMVAFQWYDHEGHGAVTDLEVASAFDALVAWSKGGPKPPTGHGVNQGVARGGAAVGGGPAPAR
jgi:hypothetical protein